MRLFWLILCTYCLKLPALSSSQLLLLLVILMITNVASVFLLSPSKVDMIPSLLSFESRCKTVSGTHIDKLTIVTYDENMALKVMQALCENKQVAKQYGEVIAYWQPDEREMFEYVGQGTADLILIKDNFIKAFDSDVTYGYQEIAAYSDYAAYLIANKEKPQLSKEYLLGKRIGILDYPSSRSGHIAPMRLFKQLGLEKHHIQISYAKSHQQLRTFLSQGNVDIISTYWSDSDNELFSINYRTPLQNEISGSKWYLKAARSNTDLTCSIQEILLGIKQDFEGYYGRLTLSSPCKSGDAQ